MRLIIVPGLLFLIGCAQGPSAQGQTTPQGRTTANIQKADDAALSAMKVSAACADAAATFWHRYGYDKPSKPTPGQSETWSYASHYNHELEKCLVATRLTTILPSGTIVFTEEIADAIEGGEPIASLTTRSPDDRVIALIRSNRQIDPTPDNLAWYKGLMTK
jgi:hypothetical protein